MEAEFAKHVYENENADEVAYRLHRFHVVTLISRGDYMALEGIEIGGTDRATQENVNEIIKEIDTIQENLARKFVEWHSPIQTTEPFADWVLEGFREAKAGQLMEFPSGAGVDRDG